MDYSLFTQVLSDLDRKMDALEDLYIENEGEVTEETEQGRRRSPVCRNFSPGKVSTCLADG